jgi:hypothetical protein
MESESQLEVQNHDPGNNFPHVGLPDGSALHALAHSGMLVASFPYSSPPLMLVLHYHLKLLRSHAQVLLNVLADEVHRAHQRCIVDGACDPQRDVKQLVFEAGAAAMAVLRGAYSCICLVRGVGLVAFRDPFGIRWAPTVRHVRQIYSHVAQQFLSAGQAAQHERAEEYVTQHNSPQYNIEQDGCEQPERRLFRT